MLDKIVQDKVKEKHTYHWDVDMMSREELEEHFAKLTGCWGEYDCAKQKLNEEKECLSKRFFGCY